MILPLSYMDVKQGHLVSSVKANGASPSKSSKSVAGKKVKSPLAHVRAWLKYLKIFGGFPLEIEDEEVTEFHLSLAGFLHVTLLYLAVATLVAGQQLVMHQYHLNMHQISEGFRAQGFSHTEIISFFFGFVPQFAVLVVDIVVIVRNRHELSKLCRVLTSIALSLDVEELKELTSSNGLRVCIMTIVVLFGALFFGLSNIYSNMWPFQASLFLGLTSAFITITTQLPPMVTTVQIIIFQCLGVLSLYFESFGRAITSVVQTPNLEQQKRSGLGIGYKNLKGHPGSFFSGKKWFSLPIKLDNYSYHHISQQERRSSVATIEELCICGFHLVEAVIQAEKALGFLIFLEIGTCLWSLILGIFFGVGLIDVIVTNNWPSLSFFYGLYQITVSILALIRLFVVFSSGQRLTCQMQDTMGRVEELVIKVDITEDGNQDNLKTKLDILSRRLGYKSVSTAAIRPLNSFDLSWSTALSCVGFLITCIVILLQFKFTELQMPPFMANFSDVCNKA